MARTEKEMRVDKWSKKKNDCKDLAEEYAEGRELWWSNVSLELRIPTVL